MLEQMQSLLRSKNMCVLATVGAGQPHCSLMAYITDENCRKLYMFTPRQTHKFRNLKENAKVSLLIDDRDAADRQQIRALTVYGAYQAVTDAVEIRQLLTQFVAVHPHLKDFVHQSDVAPLCIRISAFLLLQGPSDSHFMELPD